MHRLGPAATQVAREALNPAPPVALPAAPAAGQHPAEAHPAQLCAPMACPHTAAPCPALKNLLGHSKLVSEEARAWSQRLAPCSACRIDFAARAGALKGLRLGKREREILAGAAVQEIYVVTAPGMARATSAARRRAAQTLARAGLVGGPAKSENGAAPTAQARAAVALTPLGLYVLAAFGRFIETGKAVRWDRPRAHVPMPGREPQSLAHEVLERTRTELHATLDELKRVLIAAVARPVRDPGLLESVTRHLQSKAKGLRDLLEPASGGLAKGLAEGGERR
jgi:hypothetical protein